MCVERVKNAASVYIALQHNKNTTQTRTYICKVKARWCFNMNLELWEWINVPRNAYRNKSRSLLNCKLCSTDFTENWNGFTILRTIPTHSTVNQQLDLFLFCHLTVPKSSPTVKLKRCHFFRDSWMWRTQMEKIRTIHNQWRSITVSANSFGTH
jgi:hypothetical protein